MNRSLGQKFEELAESYLVDKGYRIINRNWHAGLYGEIDLICRDRKNLVFIEVKGRSGLRYGLQDGLESITSIKKSRLVNSIAKYLTDHPDEISAYRFDLVVILGKPPKHQIDHLENLMLF
ncbi:MAG: YraN family protein [Candidatus Caenarcaniphilales bacterium]|nr:YraN family protein [Candidatus Caenarcaniphilales bacterium]